MIGLLLVAVLAQSDAPVSVGPPLVVHVSAKPVASGEPSPGPGCWFESNRCQQMARLDVDRVACQEQLKLVKEVPPPSAKWPWVVGALLVGAAAGAGVALAAR